MHCPVASLAARGHCVPRILALALISGVAAAHAGVVYELGYRSLAQPPSAPFAAHYVIQDDKVRVAGSDGTLVFIFKDQTIYILDNTSRTVTTRKHATLDEIAALSAGTLKKLQDAVATAPPDKRAMLEQSARDMQELNERQSRPIPRDYRMTNRSESVDGHSCRIWEEHERGAKRLEFCVAAVTTLPGGADLLAGMKTLSQYWQGSMMALGVQYGPGPWWSEIQGLGGVPILMREFKGDTVVGETMLTGIHVEAPAASIFDLPEGYSMQDSTTHDSPVQ
jgi:hypothetical protein